MHKRANHLYGPLLTEKIKCLYEHFHKGLTFKKDLESQIDPGNRVAVGVESEHTKETHNKSNNLFFPGCIENWK